MSWFDKTYCPKEGYFLIATYQTPRECLFDLIKYKKGKELHTEKILNNSTSEILQSKDLELPVILVIQGKKVLEKATNGRNVKEVFPNINLKDFFIEINEIEAKLIRKEDVESLIDSFSFKDQFVALFFQSEILDSINVIETSLRALDSGKEIKLALLKEQNQSFRFQYLVKKVGVFAMAIFLFLLLMNVLVYDQFSSQKKVLSESISQNSSIFGELDQLEYELKVKQDFFNSTSWMHSTNFSFYSSEIGETVIKGLTLDELTINPVSEESKRTGNQKFDEGRIVIKGHCNKSAILNKWKKKVKDLDWVKNVDVRSFDRDNKDGGTFELVIEC